MQIALNGFTNDTASAVLDYWAVCLSVHLLPSTMLGNSIVIKMV